MSDNFLDRLKNLAAMLPKLKQQYGDAMLRKRVKRNGKLPPAAIPCALCGKRYGQQFPRKTEKKIIQPKHKPYCPTCQKKLDEGWCAIVDFAGTKFMWFDRVGVPEGWSGQVKPVSDGEFEAIKAHYQKPNAKS